MRSLHTYLQGQFTAGGTVSNKILLFDVDDTLINSDIKVYVVKNKKVIKALSSTEYNTYKLGPGESFDYKDFNSEFLLNNKSVFLKYWDTLKREYKKGTHIGILTARADCMMLRRFFLKNGIDIKKDLVFAISDPALGLSGSSIEERKAEVIERLIGYGYNTFVFFDDNQDNLETAKSLEFKYDIKVHTVKA